LRAAEGKGGGFEAFTEAYHAALQTLFFDDLW
jgi:hypothetical protein